MVKPVARRMQYYVQVQWCEGSVLLELSAQRCELVFFREHEKLTKEKNVYFWRQFFPSIFINPTKLLFYSFTVNIQYELPSNQLIITLLNCWALCCFKSSFFGKTFVPLQDFLQSLWSILEIKKMHNWISIFAWKEYSIKMKENTRICKRWIVWLLSIIFTIIFRSSSLQSGSCSLNDMENLLGSCSNTTWSNVSFPEMACIIRRRDWLV